MIDFLFLNSWTCPYCSLQEEEEEVLILIKLRLNYVRIFHHSQMVSQYFESC